MVGSVIIGTKSGFLRNANLSRKLMYFVITPYYCTLYVINLGDNEVQCTMLDLLNQFDGFETTQSVKVVMATNHIDILDTTLPRPGRIDRKIEFSAPNEEVCVYVHVCVCLFFHNW